MYSACVVAVVDYTQNCTKLNVVAYLSILVGFLINSSLQILSIGCCTRNISMRHVPCYYPCSLIIVESRFNIRFLTCKTLNNCSEEEAKLAARKYARIVQKLGFKVKRNAIIVIRILWNCDYSKNMIEQFSLEIHTIRF